MDQLSAVSRFLDNYWARSQVFRAAQFSSALVSGLVSGQHPLHSGRLMVLSREIANLRIMLRLLDDIPVLAQVIKSWRTSSQAPSSSVLERWVELANLLCTQLYYPVEHLAWAADQKIIPYNSTSLWTTGIILWGLPLLIALGYKLKQLLLKLFILVRTRGNKTGSNVRDRTGSDARGGNKAGSDNVLVPPLTLVTVMVDLVQLLCDLSLAIHWMPKGFLWGERLPPTWWGLFGTLSSLIGLYKLT